jgi:hypothetical protein
MINIIIAIVILNFVVLGLMIFNRLVFYPGQLRVWQTWFKHYYIALSDIRHLMLGCKEPPALQTVKDQLAEIDKLHAAAVARIGDHDLRKTIQQQYLLTWQACDRWIVYHTVMSENP